ncbi:MAG: hypothetical protein QOJ15_1766 [Bradyrhizobium sp.]|jgi:hypothetical protein|nr:hypothetical protein [Bradyrhizobium sp.]
MSTLEIDVGDIRPVSVAFTADELVVTLADGRRIATLLAWYPRLRDASAAARGRFELMPMGIHRSELDEDLGIAGMLGGAGRPPDILPSQEPHPTFFLIAFFPRGGIFAAASLRAMCDFSAAPMRD